MTEARNNYFLTKALEHIRKSDNAKAQFLSLLSHEIRTPLSVTMGYADLILDDPSITESTKKYLQRIKKNSEDLLSVFSSLMDTSKAQDNFEFEGLKHFNIQQLLRDVSQQVEDINGFIKIKLFRPASLPKVIVSSPNLLKKILYQMVKIGTNESEKKPMIVKVQLIEGQGGNTLKLKFSVKINTSRSLTEIENDMDFILAKELVRSLNSKICAELKANKIEIFFVTLVTYPLQQTFPFLEMTDMGSLNGLRILLIEDSPDQQVLIRRLLEKEGAAVTVVNNGIAGVEAAKSNSFEIILTDIRMPGIDGFETSLRLRNNGWIKPIIAITAHDLQSERERALLNHIDDFQLKPVNKAQLVQSILNLKSKV